LTAEVEQIVHAPFLPRKTLFEPNRASGGLLASGMAMELLRREVARPAAVRSMIHRKLRLVSGATRSAPARGNRTARQIVAALEEEISRGRKKRWSGSRAKAKNTLRRALLAHGSLPGDRAWREGLRIAAASTGLVVLRGRTVEFAFDVAGAETTDDRRLKSLNNGQIACDSVLHARSSLPKRPAGACDTVSENEDSSVRLQAGPTKERARTTSPKGWRRRSFSEWTQACGSTMWGQRLVPLLLAMGDLRGSVRDAARQLLGKAMGKAPDGVRRYVLGTAAARTTPAPPSWVMSSRQTVIRGIARTLERFDAAGLLERDGDLWRLPNWDNRSELTSRGLEEVAPASPMPPSPAMQGHLRKQGVKDPATLSAPEAIALSKRLFEERRVTRAPQGATPPIEPCCPAIDVLRVEAARRGWAVGSAAAVEQLDRVLKARTVAIGCRLAEGGDYWDYVLSLYAPRARLVAPYLAAVFANVPENEALDLPPAPMQTVRSVPDSIPIMGPVAERPWMIAAAKRAAAWGPQRKAGVT
jgi:hypothetical protein